MVGLGSLSLLIVGVFLTGFHATNVLFYYFISINFSNEESTSGVQAIYDSGILLIGALIAYNVGWFYFHVKKFSMEKTLRKAVNEMTENPFEMTNPDKWKELSEEDKVKQIIKDLLHHQARRRDCCNRVHNNDL